MDRWQTRVLRVTVLEIRPVEPAELEALNALILRSKAHWGYDATFIEACREELSLKPADLGANLVTASDGNAHLGVARVGIVGDKAELDELFIAPEAMGQSVGRRLFDWACTYARSSGARELGIDSDPFAEGFYRAMGARKIGESPSGSIPGRFLPRMVLDL